MRRRESCPACFEQGHAPSAHRPHACNAYLAQRAWTKRVHKLLTASGPEPLPPRISDDAWARKASHAGAEHWALMESDGLARGFYRALAKAGLAPVSACGPTFIPLPGRPDRHYGDAPAVRHYGRRQVA